MNIRIYMAALLFTVLGAMPAVGQQGPADRVERRVDMLDDRLDLSDAQEAQIRNILTARSEEMKAWMAENPDATRDDRRTYLRSRADDAHAAIEAVLTSEQAAKFADFRQSRRDGTGMRSKRDGRRDGAGVQGRRNGRGMQDGRGMNGGMEMHGDRFVNRIAAEFDLSAVQRQELSSIMKRHQEEGAEWRKSNPEATREQKQAFHQGHFAQLKTELEDLLTPEQLQRFEELHESRAHRMK